MGYAARIALWPAPQSVRRALKSSENSAAAAARHKTDPTEKPPNHPAGQATARPRWRPSGSGQYRRLTEHHSPFSPNLSFRSARISSSMASVMSSSSTRTRDQSGRRAVEEFARKIFESGFLILCLMFGSGYKTCSLWQTIFLEGTEGAGQTFQKQKTPHPSASANGVHSSMSTMGTMERFCISVILSSGRLWSSACRTAS
ncbi:hypothetical protein GQR58_030157 [Nymphon striatum]|nr:hypothetical protein GQR58_030157 [Nymphon striatum]